MSTKTQTGEPFRTPAITETMKVPFGVNEVRLGLRQWSVAVAIIGLIFVLVPRVWERIERFDTGIDYRIPYDLSKDYWLYGRRLRQAENPAQIIVMGDSVVWGEYVLPAGTLSHFLNAQVGAKDRFINGGLNGMFPLAEEGLISFYGKSIKHRKVIVHCNLLWMTSPKADLSTEAEEQFNHSRLVPQFSPRIPCYKADTSERLSAVLERHVLFLQWAQHLENAYYGQKSILRWTLQDDGGEPPHYPNASRNPLAPIRLKIPSAPENDPLRGPNSPRHKPWSTSGQGTTQFDWVSLDRSLQWRAFQRMIQTLRAKGNDLLVVIGPFNEHMMSEDNRLDYRKLRDGVATWLTQNQISHVLPETLPSRLYADASHPLTEGYELFAKQLYETEDFRKWCNPR